MIVIDRILDGAVDLHTHPFPSTFERQVSIDELAHQYAEAGFRAFVAKCHHHSTAPDVLALRRAGALPAAIEAYGGVALNGSSGGINPRALDATIQMGGRIVWLPTTGARNHIRHAAEAAAGGKAMRFPSADRRLMPEEPIDALDAEGRLRPELRRTIELVAEAGDVILASGHLSADEVMVVFEAAHAAGVRKLLVNHPNFVVELDQEQCRTLTGWGAVIEHSLCMYDEDSTFCNWQIDVLVDWIEAIGPEHTSLGSDLGQTNNPLPIAAYRKIVGRLLDAGVSEEAVRAVVADTPARLLYEAPDDTTTDTRGS
ncbi:MAG TPA: DUF6282 family protein [Conexibacter sp.]